MSPAQASGASDASLLARTRDGDETAYAELWLRHSAAGLTVARSFTSTLDHDDLVQESFVRVFTAVRTGGGPKGAFRPYLFTTLRNTAAEWGRKKRETSLDTLESFEDPSTSDAATEAALDRGLTAKAYRSLPTRWQEVLWYSEVEQMAPAEVAPLLGMTANSVAALAYRAREGLRQAWIQAHISSVADGTDCRWALERMGSYARSALGKRDTMRFDTHLDECAKCTIVVAEAKAVGSRLALVLLPLTIGATGASAYLAWLQSGQTAAVMAMPAGLAASVAAPTTAGAGATAAGGSSAGGGSGSAGAGASSAASGLSGGALAVGGTVVAGVLAAAVAAAMIFVPSLMPVDDGPRASPPQAAGQPPSIDDPDDEAAQKNDDSESAPPHDDPPTEDYAPVAPPAEDPPANDPPSEEPPADDPPADGTDESTPPNDVDNEMIAPDAPPAAPTDIRVEQSDGTSDPVMSGTAEPNSTITATAEPTGPASAATTATTGSSPPTLSTTSLAVPSAVSASLASPVTETEASVSTLTFTTEADGDGSWILPLSDLEPGDYSVTVTASVNGRTSAASAPQLVTGPAPDDEQGDGESSDGEGSSQPPLDITKVDATPVEDDQCATEHTWLEGCLRISSVTVNAPDGTTLTVTVDIPNEDPISQRVEVEEGVAPLDDLVIPLTWNIWRTATITVSYGHADADSSDTVDLRDRITWWGERY